MVDAHFWTEDARKGAESCAELMNGRSWFLDNLLCDVIDCTEKKAIPYPLQQFFTPSSPPLGKDMTRMRAPCILLLLFSCIRT